MKQHYTGKYFRDSMPEWKRKKDFFLARVFFREPSYYVSAFCANMGIRANTVSFFSALVAICGAIFFLLPGYTNHLIGAIIVALWNLLDCVDGNLARTIGKQPFGGFADAMSSYILSGVICTAIGVAVYECGGLFVEKGCVWIIVIGAYASASDTLMRLIYQKYKNSEIELAQMGVVEVEYDKRLDQAQTTSWRVRMESWLGIDALLNFVILLSAILNCLDIVIIYCVVYFGGACIYTITNLIRKASKTAKEHPYIDI